MIPDRTNCELAHLYFNPKTHKDGIPVRPIENNVFAYGKKIYKQTTGGAMGSSLTLPLANIFMSNWQKNIVEEQTKTGEFYGRYIDDIFMTWNRSEEELRKLLDDVNT
ncbi:unnamed protein product [Rotaria magnacalcarata]|uniref:Reverse transcriptase domain-containing protein n=1 Tax=Rotaria magnacalcarata TaxID=392030 RepID=A0A8S3JBA2_9BILA|nr:unnamed protein product [Rotaria magnacalcarata]